MKTCVNCGGPNKSKGVLCRSCIKTLDKLPPSFKDQILESAKHFEELMSLVPESEASLSDVLKVVKVADVKIEKRRNNP